MIGIMRLLVVLASPPLRTSGRRTLAHVEALSAAMPCDVVAVANLCAAPAVDLPALVAAAAEAAPWLASRDALAAALEECDEVVAAWGLYALTGPAKAHRRNQLAWLVKTAETLGHNDCWAVGGQPRHPSRWHQYVSDVHGRTRGGTFQERLRQVLTKVPLGAFA